MTKKPDKNKEASLLQLFLVFTKIGAFTIGGGYAMIPIIQRDIIDRGWLDEKEFPDIIALAQSAPGLIAVNISIFVGYKVKGVLGSLVCTLGGIIPPFLIILIIAMAFTGYQDNPTIIKIFKGIRPVVVALIAAPTIQMAKASNTKWWAWAITAASLLLVAFMKISPIYVMLTVIVVFFSISKFNEGRYKEDGK